LIVDVETTRAFRAGEHYRFAKSDYDRDVTAFRSLVGAALLVAATAEVRAQGKPQQRDPVLEAIVLDAADLPPDFASDALIRIASSPRIVDPEWRRDLLNEAFMRAYGAGEPYRRNSTTPIPRDSRQGAEQLAFETSLTRVSLQVRAAQLMAFSDHARGRELFEWIDLDVAPATCDEALVPSVDEYYSALSLLARTTFGDDRGEALRFLSLYLWRAHLPSEIPAVARALERFRPRPDEAAFLEGLFRWILNAGSTDARGFSSAAFDIVSRTADLHESYRALGADSVRVLDHLRPYLLAQLQAPRCSDSVAESQTPASFNEALKRVKVDDVKPIEGDAVWPSRVLGPARIELYWQTPEARRLHDDVLRLRGTSQHPVSESVRRTIEWRNQAERLLTDVEQWTGRREPSERDYFYQKSMLFEGLIDLMLPGAARTRAIRAFVEFMRHADADRAYRALWFAFLIRLLETARAGGRAEIFAALADSHHPVLSFYGRLERAVPAR
jgi:hypothetical protein